MTKKTPLPSLTHLNASKEAHMVDISEKPTTKRMAVAQGFIRMKPETLHIALENNAPKGDVIGTARLAGIMAAKATASSIPLCHPLALTHCHIDIVPYKENTKHHGFKITATIMTSGQTGVEMEALHAVSITALTIYDMLKAVEKNIVIEKIKLVEKHGGKSTFYANE